LPSLKRIDLRYNFLTTLPYQAIKKLKLFAFVGLSGNRFFDSKLNHDFCWPSEGEENFFEIKQCIKNSNWEIERLLWIGQKKEDEKCLFSFLPNDVIKLIRMLIV